MAKKLLVGNWKMNPETLDEAKSIAKSIARKTFRGVDIVICPPAPFLAELAKGRSKIKYGVQNIFYENSGAFTGEWSAKMAWSAGADYCIIGHSERRAMGETNSVINKKVLASLKTKLKTILCVGEKERDHHGHYLSYLKAQIDECLVGAPKASYSNLVIAYEPVWAIGVNAVSALEPRDLHEMSLFIKKVLYDHFGKSALSVPLLYGGSVDALNAERLVKEGNVDGFLVGRESIRPESFFKIANAL